MTLQADDPRTTSLRCLSFYGPPRDNIPASAVELFMVSLELLVGALGERFTICELKLSSLQAYVDRRAKAKGLYGRRLSLATNKKEIVTLRTAWIWAAKMGLVEGRFPNDGLRLPKLNEKPAFRTRTEIERLIAAGLRPAGMGHGTARAQALIDALASCQVVEK